MRANGSGTAGVEQNITYKKELRAGDLITVHSSVMEVRDRVVRFKHEMRIANTGEDVATMVITAVHMDMAVRKATPFPAEVKANLESFGN
jgi:acyl-CoA thioester hydrolase